MCEKPKQPLLMEVRFYGKPYNAYSLMTLAAVLEQHYEDSMADDGPILLHELQYWLETAATQVHESYADAIIKAAGVLREARHATGSA